MVIYQKALEFKKKYPKTICWRIKAHSKVAELHLNDDEKVEYVFTCQKNDYSYEIFRTFVVVVTDKRIILAQKRLLFGYWLISITPDMYNDLTAIRGLLWGKICIDTVKEEVLLSNIQKSALPEIETKITEYILEFRKNYDENTN